MDSNERRGKFRIVTDWEPGQLNLYRQVGESLQSIIFQDGELTLDDSDLVLKRLLRLVQVASNPRLIDSNYHAEPGKLEALLDLVDSITKSGEKCIVWTSFVDNVEWLAQVVGRHNPAESALNDVSWAEVQWSVRRELSMTKAPLYVNTATIRAKPTFCAEWVTLCASSA